MAKSVEIDLNRIYISNDNNYHLYDGEPLYQNRFKNVMSFHPPGIAAVEDESGAYHINLKGEPVYNTKFLKTFGFYEGIATVMDDSEWFQIDLEGNPIYTDRYNWVGNFQEGRCVVKDGDSNYFHIKRDGSSAYEDKYRYAGDYKYGIAVVYQNDGYGRHIDKDGRFINDNKYIELGVFHKGLAVARDGKGYFHINQEGNPIYQKRYEWIEPFYNNYALARDSDGNLIVIDQKGKSTHKVTDNSSSSQKQISRKKLMGKLVGYWQTQILYCIAKTEILDKIKEGHNTKKKLSEVIRIPDASIQMLIDVMKIWNLIIFKDNKIEITMSGDILTEDSENSLKHAAIMWGEEHYIVMSRLLEALKTQEPQFKSVYGESFFEYIKNNSQSHYNYNAAMKEYAIDYSSIIKKLPLSEIKTLLDVGGGTGFLITEIIRYHKGLKKCILFDLPEVISQIKDNINDDLIQKIEFVKGDFFKDELPKSEAIIISRVLHDWDNGHAKTILLQLNKAMPIDGRLFILEMIVPDELEEDFGITLNFNLLVIVGGHERRKKEFIDLLENSGFKLTEIIPSNEIISTLVCKKIKDMV